MATLLRQGHPFWHGLLRLALLFNFLAVPPLAVLLPHWTIVWFYGGVVCLPALAWLAYDQRPRIDPALLGPVALFFLWCAVTVLWTPADRGVAIWLALRTFTTLAGALLLLEFNSRLPADFARAVKPWVLPGFLLAALLLIAEHATHLGLTSLISGESFEGPRWADRLNRGALAVVLHAFAPALVLWHLGRRRTAFALFVASLVLVSFYRSETALVAGMAALIVLAIALHRARDGYRLFLGLGFLSVIAALPLALLLPAIGLQEDGNLDITARARVQIWSFTAERILERPFFGWGLDAAAVMPNRGVEPLLPFAEKVIPIHPHNGALQIWLEVGLPGLVLALWAFWRLARGLSRLPKGGAAFLAAAGASILIAQSLSFGIWQSRWLALAFIILLQVRLLIRAEEPD